MLPTKGMPRSNSSKTPQYLVTFAATLLVFGAGTTLGWSSPALHMYDEKNSTLPIHPTAAESSWISSLLTVGALIGALPSGSVADLLGRKLAMQLVAVPLLLSWVIIVFAKTVTLVYAARLIAGIALGAVCTLVPLYINEISESCIRGVLGSAFQLLATSGIVFSYFIGALTSYYKMASIAAVIPVIFLCAFYACPETPTYLLKKGRKEEAERSLQSLRGIRSDISKELQGLENEMEEKSGRKTSFLKALSKRETRMGVIISLGMMFCQQFSGINIVVFYSSKIFEAAGSTLEPQVCTILVGVAQVVATVISMILIDKAGRKILLQISAASMIVCLGVLGYYFMLKDGGEDVSSLSLLPVVALVSYILLFGIGFGPIPWMMSAEVLPEDVKGVCSGLAVSLNWTLAFVLTLSFQSLTNAIGNAGTYWSLAAINIFSFLFITFVVIETKGKSLQDIQDELAGVKSKPDVVV
uniref:Facilitated trehalose transporter Tret1 n=2 Tax=Lygus hesperus TaxID=30085 RepID=A0A0A9YBT6_LYGHE